MGHSVTTLAQSAPAAVIAPLIPGIPVFGSGVRQTFTSSGNYVSDGKPIRVYVIGAAGGNGSTKNGGGGEFATGIILTPPVGNISVVIGAKGAALSVGGTSSFGATDILITALGGSGGTDMGSGGDGGQGGVFGASVTSKLRIFGCMGNRNSSAEFNPFRSGAFLLPYGISGSDPTSGAGVVIIEY